MFGLTHNSPLARILSDYGMLFVLLLLCVLFSVLTMQEQTPTGREAAVRVAELTQASKSVLIVVSKSEQDSLFVDELISALRTQEVKTTVISGDPATVRAAFAALDSSGTSFESIATTQAYSPIVRNIRAEFQSLSSARVLTAPSRKWPTFLLGSNLRNVANQITVIAIIAIGMTMVIITAGIDLSVGSLIALSAVVIAWIVGALGGAQVSTPGILLAGLGAIVVCGATGAFSGLMTTGFRIPPFIATLAMMQVAAGIAYILSEGKPIYQLPEHFVWLGRGVDPLFDIPIAVILMFVLYILAFILMEKTVLGRYIYAVGGNAEAARLAGIRVNWVLLFVYTMSGVLAGFGGILMASQLKSGAPTYGLTYELYVIAAVVVGGTSLSGGEGRIFGTLIGAFIIGVIQNGMNLTNIETYTQKVVLGLVILAAVLFDRLKQRGLARSSVTVKSIPREENKVTST